MGAKHFLPLCAWQLLPANLWRHIENWLPRAGRTTENINMPVHFRAVDNAVETVKKVKEYVNNGFGVTLDVALDLEEVSKESERVKELEDTMLQYVEMEREMEHWVKAAELAKAEFNRKYDATR